MVFKFYAFFSIYHQRLPAPDVQEEDEDDGRGQLDQSDRNEADIGVLSELDLVSTERGERLRRGRKKMRKLNVKELNVNVILYVNVDGLRRK